MGTSASSSGPAGRVPLIPPWVPEPEIEPAVAPDGGQGPEIDEPVVVPPAPPPLAPAGRFRGARTHLGQYARSGSEGGLRRGLGHYVRTGLGGSRNASRRMVSTAMKAGALHGVLYALSSGTAPQVDLGIDPAGLEGRPAREIADRIAEALSPSDGTLDSEASRTSMSWALCEFMRREPEADLLSLTLGGVVSRSSWRRSRYIWNIHRCGYLPRLASVSRWSGLRYLQSGQRPGCKPYQDHSYRHPVGIHRAFAV